MSDALSGDARLIVLRHLSEQSDGRSNDLLLDRVLDALGVRRSRDWLRTQLRRLAELDAVKLDEMGSVLVVTLRQAGRDHVDRRALLDGVSRPLDLD